MYPPQSIRLYSKDRPVWIHLFSTGCIADKTRMRSPRFKGPAALIDSLIDRCFTEWLPVWTALIEHPEGVFLIDTGMNAAVSKPGYFRPAGPVVRWYDSTQFRFDITPDQVIHRQLLRTNLPKPDAIILTHLHFDHTGDLSAFPEIPVLVNRQEWEHPHGPFLPSALKPGLLALDRPLPPFQHSCPLTADGDLTLVHTPGHTDGHSSVLLRTDTVHLLFAGDICYDEAQLLQERYPANLARRRLAKQTYAHVRSYARFNPLIFLPSHDPHAAQRLQNLQTLPRKV